MAEKQILIQSAGIRRLSFNLPWSCSGCSGAAAAAEPRLGGGEGAAGGGAGGSGAARRPGARRRHRRTRDGRLGRARELAALTQGVAGTAGLHERARFSIQPGGPALRPRTAPSARRARASLLLPRRAPRLSFYSLLPTPSLRGGARCSRHSPALPTRHPRAAPTPPLPCPPMPLAKSRLPMSRQPLIDGHASRTPLRPMI